MNWIVPYIPAIVTTTLLLLCEAAARAPRTDWRINLQAMVLRYGALAFMGGTVVRWHGASLIDGQRLPVWAAVVLYVLIYDLGEFLYHVASHRVPMLWAMHSLHHSDPEMSVLTTDRHYWGDALFKTITIWSLSALLISPRPEAVTVYALLGLWNLFLHSRLEIDLGRWSWVINSPAYHRRHHSLLPEHYDSNFAALFPIWDVIFGHYHRPEGFPPTGLETGRPTTLRELLLWPIYHDRASGAPALTPTPR